MLLNFLCLLLLFPFALSTILPLPSSSFKLIVSTPRGQFIQILQPFNQNVDIFSLSQGLVRDAVNYNIFDSFPIDTPPNNPSCLHGRIVEEVCECYSGWAGRKCSIHIHMVNISSVQMLLHPVQYFMLKGEDINEIMVNWENTKVFLVSPETGEDIQELTSNTRFIPTPNNIIYKITGNIGDLIQFLKSSSLSLFPLPFENYLYLAAFAPAIIYSCLFLVKKLVSKKREWKRMAILEKTTRNEEECSICLAVEPVGGKVVLGCGHSFHGGCLGDWLRGNGTCPYCRGNVDVGVSEDEIERMGEVTA